MTTDFLIGIDVGTSSVKAGLFSLEGELLDFYSAAYPTQYPVTAFVEQDPAHWMAGCHNALQRFDNSVGKGKVHALGLTSQINTHVFCDEKMQVLAPAMVWQDGRATAQAFKLESLVSTQQRLDWWVTPMPVDASHILPRMLWMSELHPAIWQRTKHVLLPKDYCLYQLTGELVSDGWSNVGLVDHQLEFIQPLLELIPGAQALLPPLNSITQIAGRVKSGLPFSGVPVAVGTMDAWAAAFGTGATHQGMGMYLGGSSEILGIVSNEINPTPGVLVMPRCHDITMHIGPTQFGGASQKWFCQLLGIEPEAMAELAVRHNPGKPCPLFLPHLQGERAPLWNADTRGVLLGLQADTDLSALARGVYQGVALSARWLLESLANSAGQAPDALNVGGGGFQSNVWNQIRADTLQLTLARVSVTHPGTLGAAGIAAVATGVYNNVQQAFAALVRIDHYYEPDPSVASQMQEQMSLYKDTYRQTSPLSYRWLNPEN